MRQQLLFFVLIFMIGNSSVAAGSLQKAQPNEKPALVVLLVVDQMRADHLSRFAGMYRYGFARLAREGALFTDAHHEHAYTVTAVGHATIATGAFPSRHGVAGNDWYDMRQMREVYCAEDTGAALLGYENLRRTTGRSPRALLATTFGDWLKAQSPKSKVFGVARKDRAAIFTTGLQADGAFWYSGGDGNFITSSYYYKAYPDWAAAFNESRAVDRYLDTKWLKDRPEEDYFVAREDTFSSEADGIATYFPHALEAEADKPDRRYYARLQTSPFIEELVLEFARQMIDAENLGDDAHPDVLFIGFSGADDIGHRYGPLSQESMDYFMHVDRFLGDFLDDLDQKFGKGKYVTVLSSDHGVLPMPEELARRGFDSKRIPREDIFNLLRESMTTLAQEIGVDGQLITNMHGYSLYVNYRMAAQKGLSPAEIDRKLIAELKKAPFIAEVYTKEELASKEWTDRPQLQRYRNSYYADRGGDLYVRLKPHYLIDNQFGTSHGSPYAYDSHVPLLFAGPGIAQKRIDAHVGTVDIAPTIAALLGITPPAEIDGKSLLELIRK